MNQKQNYAHRVIPTIFARLKGYASIVLF